MEPTTGGSLSAEDDASDVERKEVMALKFISSVCDRLTGMQEVPSGANLRTTMTCLAVEIHSGS